MRKSLKGGRGEWFVGERYLTIHAWEPYFKPIAVACSKVVVWTRVLGPLLIHNKESIASIIREGYMSLFETSKTSASITIWNVTSWASILKKDEGETLND